MHLLSSIIQPVFNFSLTNKIKLKYVLLHFIGQSQQILDMIMLFSFPAHQTQQIILLQQSLNFYIVLNLTDNMDPFELDKEFQINSNQQDGYYHEYCRLLLANIALTSQMKEIIEEKNQLLSRLRKYEDDEFNSQSQRMNDKIKRMRRNADQIQRYYRCSVKVCGKSYGSEGSLNQHYKLKHPEIYVNLPNVQSNLSQAKEEFDQNSRDKENRHKNINLKHK